MLVRFAQFVFLVCLVAVAVFVTPGCQQLKPQPMPDEVLPDYGPIQNPLAVPMLPRALVMDEVSDELDNYFRIKREERVRLVDDVLTEGWIETHPKIGSTAIEPWRRDSTPGFEMTHATLQTVRRFAKVRVIPTHNTYLIDVRVYKELEDLPQPQESTISGKTFRHDNTLDIDDLPEEFRQTERGWIPMGRDMSLEALILQNIQTRLQTAASQPLTPPHK